MDNFTWDFGSKLVKWNNEGVEIEKRVDNAFFATVNEDKQLIYVEAGENYNQDSIFYFSYDGTLILSISKKENYVEWKFKNKNIEKRYENVSDAQIYESNIIILADETLYCYKINGELLFETNPDNGYKFIRLTTINNTPYVVCDGGSENADKFGRSSWNYEINIDKGVVLKKNLAY